jgi:predicted MFS family arabinose efflux permease
LYPVRTGVVLLIGASSGAGTVVGTVLWGLAFGGVGTQLQAALIIAGGDSAEVASSFIPVAFNIAIVVSGVLGAGILVAFNGLVLAVVMIAFGFVAVLLTVFGGRSAFPAHGADGTIGADDAHRRRTDQPSSPH